MMVMLNLRQENSYMPKTILLSQNKVAIISDEDYDHLSQWKWSFHGKYAHRIEWVKGGKGKQIRHYMHSVIMSTPKGYDTDHINGDKLDNRRENLRVCTRSENNANKPKQVNNKTGYKGVSWSNTTNRYVARLVVNKKLVLSRNFKTAKEAAEAYNDKVTELQKTFGQLNIMENK